jgi:hypothetical protein
MAAATYAAMLAAARTLVDERGTTSDTFASPTEGLGFVNRAVEMLCSEIISAGGHEFLATTDSSDATVSGTSEYDVPDDHGQTIAIGLQWSADELEDVPAFEWAERSYLTGETWGQDHPKGYRIVGDHITFLPVPTSAVTIVHVYLPRYDDASTDTATFDGRFGRWRDAIEYNIAARLARMNGPEFASFAREFDRLCSEAVENVREAASNRAYKEAPRPTDEYAALTRGRTFWWPRVPA